MSQHYKLSLQLEILTKRIGRQAKEHIKEHIPFFGCRMAILCFGDINGSLDDFCNAQVSCIYCMSTTCTFVIQVEFLFGEIVYSVVTISSYFILRGVWKKWELFVFL